jgi:hypothetical protein
MTAEEAIITKTYQKLVHNRKQLAQLTKQLGHSLRIAEIWPRAFENGQKCSPILTGINWPEGSLTPFMSSGRTYPEPYHRVRKITRTFLRREDGLEKDITPEDFFSIFEGPQK